MTDVISKQVKKQRGQQLAQLEQQQRGHYFQRLVGRQLQVLVESTVADQPGWLQGTSARYATVRFPGPAEWIGQLVSVEAEQREDEWMLARPLASLSSLA
jgi:tRNA A37 methylthiotransferase MiaB